MSDKKPTKTDEKAPETVAKQPETSVKPAEAPTKGKVVKVKFLRSHPAFAITIGEETEISQDDFDKYSEAGPFFERIHTR